MFNHKRGLSAEAPMTSSSSLLNTPFGSSTMVSTPLGNAPGGIQSTGLFSQGPSSSTFSSNPSFSVPMMMQTTATPGPFGIPITPSPFAPSLSSSSSLLSTQPPLQQQSNIGNFSNLFNQSKPFAAGSFMNPSTAPAWGTTTATNPTQQSQLQAQIIGSSLAYQPSKIDESHPFKILENVQLSYDPHSPLCQFKHVFYNSVDPADVNKYIKPSNVDEKFWTQALTENPDPKSMVPVIAVGFDDLNARIGLQNERRLLYKQKLQELEIRINDLLRKQNLDTLVKLKLIRKKYVEYSSKLLRVMTYIDIIRRHGVTLSNSEENFRVMVQSLSQKLVQENTSNKVTELSERVKALVHDKKFKSYLNVNNQFGFINEDNQIKEDLLALLTEEQKALRLIVDDCKAKIESIYKMEEFIKTKYKYT